MKPDLLTNIGTLVSPTPLHDASILWEGETIRWVGKTADLPKNARDAEITDAGGALVTPGLIDCHTHLLFAGSRADEFFARLGGSSYEEIARKGGGIARTVKSTGEASDAELSRLFSQRLDRFLSWGVTTVEVKSGYGLSTSEELRHLRLIRKSSHPVSTMATFLGAHVVPNEYRSRRDDYRKLVTEEMLPAVAREKLAFACDVFCDEGAFTVAESREILTKARSLGLAVKLHADQLKGTGAAELAAEIGALSADHLERVSDAGIEALARAGVVGVLLPGAVFSLGKKTYPPARKLIEGGVRVAISTDCNPGTSYTENLPLMMSFAAIELKMSVEEIWDAVTVNAALAMGLSDRGVISAGKRADFVVWDAEEPGDVIYHYGACRPRQAVAGGQFSMPHDLLLTKRGYLP